MKRFVGFGATFRGTPSMLPMHRRVGPLLVLLLLPFVGLVALNQSPQAAQAVPAASEWLQVTVYLTPVADASVDAAAPDTNFGLDAALQVYYGGSPQEMGRSLIRFNLAAAVPPEAEIDEAWLEVYLLHTGGLDLVPIRASLIRADWEEAHVTWGNQPPFSEPTQETPVDAGLGYKRLLVTEIVRAWHNVPHYGLILQGPETGPGYNRVFQSRHPTDLPPHLLVTFHTPPTPTATASATTAATFTPTPSRTATPSAVPPATATRTATPSAVPTATPPATATATPSAIATATVTPTRTSTTIATGTPSPTVTPPVALSVRLMAAQGDAYVAQDASSTNFGAAPILMTQRHPGTDDEALALVWFDMSDMLTQTEIITAYLSLVLTGTQDSGLSAIGVYPVLSPWQEMTVTWDTRPSHVAGPLALTAVATTTQEQVFWDISPLVQDWVSNPVSNHGVALRVPPETAGPRRIFGSRESDAAPMLIVIYAVPPIEFPEPSPTPLPAHITTTLVLSDSAYLRWDGYDNRNLVRQQPEQIVLSADGLHHIQERFLLSFNLSQMPTDTVVYQAYLELYLQGGVNPTPLHLIANMMEMPWSRQTASWAARVGASNEETDAPRGFARVGLATPQWVSFDVTRMVRRWIAYPNSNHGVQVRGPSDADTDTLWSRLFAGPQAGSLAPRLVILHAPAGAPGYDQASASEVRLSAAPPPTRDDLCPLGPLQIVAPDFPPGYGQRRQLGIISSTVMITGTASGPHVSHEEYPPTHDQHDFCFDVSKNSANAWAMGGANKNEIEVEWENNVWDQQAWPTENDEVIVFGPWVYDCEHDVEKGGKTEIHPPFGVVSIRKQVAGDVSSYGGKGYVLLRRADIFFSNQRTRASCGGWCEHGESAYIDLGGQDYEFDLYPTANRATGAVLAYWTVDHSWSWGSAVKPVITKMGSGDNQYLHVKLPYRGKSGKKLHTDTSIYYGWTRTSPDVDLRSFAVQVHGIDITDNADTADAEWYVWVNINNEWFNLRDYIYSSEHAGIGDAGDTYYATDIKDLVAHVIVPNDASGSISVRAHGYESDSRDDAYGLSNLVPKLGDVPLNPFDPVVDIWGIGICIALCDNTDTIQDFGKTFTKTDSFGAGIPATTYYATGDGDGQYGLKISISEEEAPVQYRSMAVGVGDPYATAPITFTSGMTVDGHCMYEEYAASDVISFTLSTGDIVNATAAYDNDALYVCINLPRQSALDHTQAVVYLDPGNPSTATQNRADDLRVSFPISPSGSLVASLFDPTTGNYDKAVPSGLVTAAVDIGWDIYGAEFGYGAEFRIAKSLVPRGPWSKTVGETSLLTQGIGGLLAIEKSGATRLGAWPGTAYPTGPDVWARLYFLPGCPVRLDVTRIGDVIQSAGSLPTGTIHIPSTRIGGIQIGGHDIKVTLAGDQATLVLDYDVTFDHPRCNLQQGKLMAEWPGDYLQSVAGTTEGGTSDNGVITWTLPTTPLKGQYSVTLQEYNPCFMKNPPLEPSDATGTFSSKFSSSNVPAALVTDTVGIYQCTGFRVPDTRMWPGGGDWPRGMIPPWIYLHDPARLGDPPELRTNVVNMRDIPLRVMVRSMDIPAGVSSPDAGGNLALDFNRAPATSWYTAPPNSAIAISQKLQSAGTHMAQEGGASRAVAMEVSLPDTWLPPQTTIYQIVPYVSLNPGRDNVITTTVWNTVRQPSDLHLQAVAHCPDWQASVVPEMQPVRPAGTGQIVEVHLRPPEGRILGSGCPVDIIAWTDTGEFAGAQRILDLPPVQVSPDEPLFASSQIEIEPARPRPGDQTRACAIVRNRSNTTRQAEVLIGMSERLSTAPNITSFSTVPVTVPAAGLARACAEPFTWTGDRSFQAIIRQSGYQDQVIRRHVATAPMSTRGSPPPISLDVRNPLTATTQISLTYGLVGLPGWDMAMPASVVVGAGETTPVIVRLTPPREAMPAIPPGDEGRVEILAQTPDGLVVGGAWLMMWQREWSIYLPVIVKP